MTTSPSTARTARAPAMQRELLRLLDALPHPKQVEVLDFARFLHQQATGAGPTAASQVLPIDLRAAPASTLLSLSGLIALGGDAVADTEALYDDDGLH